MKISEILPYLKRPGSDAGSNFASDGEKITDLISGKTYPLVHEMIDFQGNTNLAEKPVPEGVMFRLNHFYSNYIDAFLRTSIFAGGGVIFIKALRKMKTWIDATGKKKTLLIEPEDNNLVDYLGAGNCVTVEDFNAKNVFPLPSAYPNINASMEELPINSSSFEVVISNYVLEHVIHPRHHMREVARILKPGGYLILSGPGDIYPSHRVPYNYFNVIRYGYYEMFKENNLELVEEYFPARSWLSILYISYATAVRNSWFNKNQFTKLLHLVALGISVILSPLFNLLAMLMDLITPFDKRGYAVYLALVKKPEQ